MPEPDDDLAARAAALHRDSVVVDAHSDILMGLTDGTAGWEDDRPPAPKTPLGTGAPTEAGCDGQVSLPLLRAGGVTAQVCAVFTAPFGLDYRVVRPEFAGATLPRALALLATFHEALHRHPERLRLATTAADVRRARADGVTAGILSFEGLDPIGHDLRLLRLLRALGVTIASLTWSNRNPLADGSSTARHPGGLTPLGEEAVAELERLRILIDLAHLGPVATEEVLERATRPLLISHTRLMDEEGRGAAPATLRRVGAPAPSGVLGAGGVACAIFYRLPTVAALADLLERLIEHCGPAGVGLGADFYGTRHAPAEVQTAADYPRITEELLRRGHDDATVRGILGENVLRLYERVVG
ncbi:MAG TPA: membrane dipeptidase [Thermomicrobiales bacterium]|nr:membrane dipeptidase [Thermomicrobiales bacterium]